MFVLFQLLALTTACAERKAQWATVGGAECVGQCQMLRFDSFLLRSFPNECTNSFTILSFVTIDCLFWEVQKPLKVAVSVLNKRDCSGISRFHNKNLAESPTNVDNICGYCFPNNLMKYYLFCLDFQTIVS
jgi:hypothetical protein